MVRSKTWLTESGAVIETRHELDGFYEAWEVTGETYYRGPRGLVRRVSSQFEDDVKEYVNERYGGIVLEL